MRGIRPVRSFFESQCGDFILIKHATTAVIKMQMRKKHIGDVSVAESCCLQGSCETITSVQVIVTEKFCVLFIANAVIDQYRLSAILNKQTPHGPRAEVPLIRGIQFLPYRLRHHAKHRAAIQLKKSGIDDVKIQTL
jgi:hypothetical protein